MGHFDAEYAKAKNTTPVGAKHARNTTKRDKTTFDDIDTKAIFEWLGLTITPCPSCGASDGVGFHKHGWKCFHDSCAVPGKGNGNGFRNNIETVCEFKGVDAEKAKRMLAYQFGVPVTQEEPTELPSVFEDRWGTISYEELLSPPKRSWLLKTTADKGAIPLGKCIALAAGGGTGKTIALCQLAVAVASGKPWFDFQVEQQGKVCLLLGEEDREETIRRIYGAMNALDLSTKGTVDRRAVLQQIVAVPLAGCPVALVQNDGRSNIEETRFLAELRDRLEKEGPWALVVLDPLSRFASQDAEKDNAAATRFVQAAESLVKAPGNPTVLVSAHSSQQSLEAGKANMRGVTGLVDGFRQVMTLTKVGAGDARGVRLRCEKTNYTMPWDDQILCWQDRDQPSLVVASQTQLDAIEAATEKQAAERKQKAKAKKAAAVKVAEPSEEDLKIC
jgi:hypothetical protein